MLRTIVFAMALLHPGLVAAQPVSWGMAQCSALMDVMGSHVSKQPQKSHLADAASKFFVAAQARSHAEGRDPVELTRVRGKKRDEWVSMGGLMAFRSEFRDWVGYCRSLAKAHKISLHQSMM